MKMKKVECISQRSVSSLNTIEIGKTYYLDITSIDGDSDGDWYGDIYEDNKKNNYISHLKLSHFKSC